MAAMRKYASEISLVLTVSGMVLSRAQDLGRQELPPSAADCHLYLVCVAPRVSVDPASVSIGKDAIDATVRLQRQGTFEPWLVRYGKAADFDVAEWVSDWPHEEFALRGPTGEQLLEGVVSNTRSLMPRGWPDAADELSVVYVGQAFGKAGERTAADRLSSHKTLQRILAETASDQQVWLMMAGITDTAILGDLDPRFATSTTDATDDEHVAAVFQRLQSGSFVGREGVALAEAALIRYFQPVYNEKFKNRFPDPGHVSLETAHDLDLYSLIIEMQSMDLGVALGSSTRAPAQLHFQGFEVHHETDRSVTLTMARFFDFGNDPSGRGDAVLKLLGRPLPPQP
jgi:hypothetical protein